jgi:hypothetical protein
MELPANAFRRRPSIRSAGKHIHYRATKKGVVPGFLQIAFDNMPQRPSTIHSTDGLAHTFPFQQWRVSWNESVAASAMLDRRDRTKETSDQSERITP